MNVFNAVITLLLTPYFATRIHCKTVRIFAYSSTREQSNKSSEARLKTREKLGRDAKNTLGLPRVPEVLLACGGNFRCWPKADTSSAVSARSAFSLFEERAQDLSVYCHFHSLSIFQKTLHCTVKQRSRLLWNYWIQSSPKDSKPSADNNTRYSLAKSITGCIKFIKRVALWMDFWQLDDIFELLGQNESLHGKRTVVFCLSLSPPRRLPVGIPMKIENNRKNKKRAGDQHKQASAEERVSLASRESVRDC